jgi:hypothetical protein
MTALTSSADTPSAPIIARTIVAASKSAKESSRAAPAGFGSNSIRSSQFMDKPIRAGSAAI